MAPTIQILEPPAHQRLNKMEHKRWKSDPEKTRRDMAKRSHAPIYPYSYEYHFDAKGRIGLKEFHGDIDFAHYSARSKSVSTSSHSSRPSSRDDNQVHTIMDSRRPSASHAPPPSPRKGDALKRALTLHGLKRRASSEVKKTPPPSPYSPRPEIEKLAASFGRKGPQHITSPLPALPPPKPHGMFEMPRAAPRPPSRDTPNPSPRPELSPTLSSTSRGKDYSISSHDFVLRPRLPPTPPRSPMVDQFPLPPRPQTNQSIVTSVSLPPVVFEPPSPDDDDVVTVPFEDMSIESTQATKKTPILRRKGSARFIDHIERKEKLSPRMTQKDEIPPVPPMVFNVVEFNHPINGPVLKSPLPAGMASPAASPKAGLDSPSIGSTSPSSPFDQGPFPQVVGRTPTISITKAESPSIPFAESMEDSAVKRSSSLMRPLPQTPNRKLGRSNTTATRPPPKMSDVCMAEVKPVLTSGIIAQGHARMISC